MSRFEKLLDRLGRERRLATEEYEELVRTLSREEAAGEREELFARARRVREAVYGKKVYIRGLVEVSNVCRNDCYYCGIRKSNGHAVRYRMDQEEILECCREGYRLGFRTFVFQGGEDPAMTDQVVEALVAAVHREFPDCAITQSLGETERESYQRFFDAGASRYLLRHETASPEHYRRLHPPSMSWEHRVQCLRDLKENRLSGGLRLHDRFAVSDCEASGGGSEIHGAAAAGNGGHRPVHFPEGHAFRDFPGGGLTQTLMMLGLIRLLLPRVLLPATTALGTIDPEGRQKGILAGANVVMPNLSPPVRRKQYMLYDNKLGTGEESAEGLALLKAQMQSIGYQVVTDRGDYPGM